MRVGISAASIMVLARRRAAAGVGPAAPGALGVSVWGRIRSGELEGRPPVVEDEGPFGEPEGREAIGGATGGVWPLREAVAD